MSLQRGEYIIAQKDEKFLLVKVRSADEDRIKGVVEQSELEGKRVSIELEPEEVLIRLGDNPPYGTIYGQKIEPLRKTLHFDSWGDLHFYRKTSKSEKVNIKKALDHVYRELQKRNLLFIFPITVELRNKAGRYDGHYKISPRYDNVHNHLIELAPKDYHMEPLIALVRHEVAHAVWFKGVSRKMRLRWIKMYTYYMTLKTAKMDMIQSVRKGLEDAGDVYDYRAELRAEETDDGSNLKLEILDECLSHLKGQFNLDKEDVDVLVNSGESLEPYWPRNPFDISESKGEVVMTDYGMTKPAEFFAEAFRMYLEGRLGKRLTKLMDKTLKRVIRGKNEN